MNKPKIFYGWYLVAASWVTMATVGAVMVSVFFKPMLDDFGLDRAELSMVQSAAMIVFTILSPLLGRVIDQFGPRVMITISLFAQLFSRVINGLATRIWHLYASRVFFIMNAMPSTQVMVNRWFVKKRGTALGIMASGSAVGIMLLPPVSQYLILQWGWRPTMLFWAAVTVAVSIPLVLIVRNDPKDKGLLPDGGFAEIDSPNETEVSVRDTVTGASGNGDTGVLQALRTPGFWYLLSAHFICGIGCGFLFTHSVIFAIDMGYSEMIAASLVSVQGGVNLFGVLATGPLSDRFSRKNVMAFTHFIRSLSFGIAVIFIIMGGAPLWLLFTAIAFLVLALLPRPPWLPDW